MKYALELTINKPRAEVWRIFDDPNNMDKWQPSLTRTERLEGTAGQPGSVAKLTYTSGEREYSLIEKVIHRQEPERHESVYVNEFADNTIKNTFLDRGGNETLWKVEVEFKFKTRLMNLVSPFVKKRFVANTQRDMDRFKTLVEGL
jgi:uncharacterized protein YndB with AHSA1/START domain